VHEGHGLFQRQEFVVGGGQRMRQRRRQALAPVQRTQPAPEQGAAGVRGKLLLSEANGDCFAVGFELKCPGHRLVIRACARRLCCFHLPPINPQSVASFQLHGFGSASPACFAAMWASRPSFFFPQIGQTLFRDSVSRLVPCSGFGGFEADMESFEYFVQLESCLGILMCFFPLRRHLFLCVMNLSAWRLIGVPP
jgi:hypothetical protein